MSTTTTLLGPAEIRELAERAGVRPTKQLGQNFVLDGGTVRKIVRQADVEPGDRVVEVGPGLGSLTLGLLEAGADVVAVEIDPTLARLLPTTVARHVPGLTVVASADDEPVVLRDDAGRDRLTIVLADALDVRALPGPPPVALVANLPYNVSVPVLLTFLERFDSLERVLVMVQAEVADRLAAPPGSRTYGVPSAKGRLVRVGPPDRDGRPLGLLAGAQRRLGAGPLRPSRAPGHRRVAGGGVRRRRRRLRAARKMLRSALSVLAGSSDLAVAALEAAGVDPQARGERVDIAGFARIAEHLGPGGGRPGIVEP
jgi:16S rRNA (adenine1518-N6/adenine1519-N6)-dimethyltransferase